MYGKKQGKVVVRKEGYKKRFILCFAIAGVYNKMINVYNTSSVRQYVQYCLLPRIPNMYKV